MFKKKIKPATFKTQIMTVGTANRNGRVYPMNEVKKMIAETKVPFDGVFETSLFIESDRLNLSDVSHRVHSLELKGDKVFANVEVLKTEKGQVLQSLMDGGSDLAFRTLGYCSYDYQPDGTMLVKDYQLTSVIVMPAENAA